MIKYPLGFLLIISILFSACDKNRVFEGKKDFKQGYWLFSDAAQFDFKIDDPTIKYDLSFNVRAGNKYHYQNLYLQYYLEDSTGRTLKKDLVNAQLFNAVTGVPLGEGLGDLYDLQRTFLTDYQFDKAGEYRLRFDHFMRKDTLPEIYSVGLRIEKSLAKEEE